MSLQPGINPLDRRMQPGMRTMEVRNQHRSFPSAEEMERRMQGNEMLRQLEMNKKRQEIENMGGFDSGDLMAAPKLRQDATMNQANMVSSPYFEANAKAAEKTNPMNAASQEPGKSFLMKFIGK